VPILAGFVKSLTQEIFLLTISLPAGRIAIFGRIAVKKALSCPHCGQDVVTYRNPIPTTDIIIMVGERVVLIKRKNPPLGWALPGGFIDYGESAEQAAVREAREETSLEMHDLRLFGVYSAPDRDPRHHTLTVVFTAQADGTPVAGDDAQEVGLFSADDMPSPMAFDHGKILADFFRVGVGGSVCKPDLKD
jgi:ADP-ribose pyrophosphatase YjhB (NUDIX family)